MRRLAFLLLSFLPVSADIAVLEEIVAKVNGDIVTRSDIERARAQLRQGLEAGGAKGQVLEEAFKEREPSLLRDKIDSLLLIQKAKELNINVDPQVSRQMAEIQSSAKISDPDKFQEFVRQQTGMSFEDYKSETRERLLTQTIVRQEVGGKINIPRGEVRKYYDEHNAEFVRKERIFLREIFLSTQGKDAPGIEAADKKSKDLAARAKKGERFFELARDNSDSESAADGGMLPPQERENLRDELRFLFEQERGFVSDPIKLPNGFLILRIEEKHREGLASFEEVENEAMEKLFQPRFEPKIREYLTQLRQDAFLEIKEGYVDANAAPGKNTAWTDPLQLKPETVTKKEVLAEIRRKRLLWMVPLPGTTVSGVSSSR